MLRHLEEYESARINKIITQMSCAVSEVERTGEAWRRAQWNAVREDAKGRVGIESRMSNPT